MIFLNQWLLGNARSAAVPDLCGGEDWGGGAGWGRRRWESAVRRATHDAHENPPRKHVAPRAAPARGGFNTGSVSFRPGRSSGYDASFACSIAWPGRAGPAHEAWQGLAVAAGERHSPVTPRTAWPGQAGPSRAGTDRAGPGRTG